jgi:uncharacterized protein (DUF1697 family)
MTHPLYIALLRGVNVAGHRRLTMKDLVAAAAKLGLENPRTLLASGNLVFGAAKAPSAAALAKALGTDVIIRDAKAWTKLVAAAPFDTKHLVLVALADAPTKTQIAALRAAMAGKGREEIAVKGKDLYAVYPDGQGRSKLTNAVIERHLGTKATARNWNTVLKLAALVEA